MSAIYLLAVSGLHVESLAPMIKDMGTVSILDTSIAVPICSPAIHASRSIGSWNWLARPSWDQSYQDLIDMGCAPVLPLKMPQMIEL